MFDEKLLEILKLKELFEFIIHAHRCIYFKNGYNKFIAAENLITFFQICFT